MHEGGRWESAKHHARALAKLGALGVGLAHSPNIEQEALIEPLRRRIHVYVEEAQGASPEGSPSRLDNPEYADDFPGGEFSKEEKKERTKILSPGCAILEDVGLDFYLVQQNDSIDKIRTKLLRHPERYGYLKEQTERLESFNIDTDDLRPGMWIPIPINNAERKVSDEDFFRYAKMGVNDAVLDATYSEPTKHILGRVSEDELAATLVAIAKQESGGAPIGTFEYERYEPRYGVFSYSPYHVLDIGTGKQVRQTLGMTRGQTYHPENATLLALGFIIEKSHDAQVAPENFFPIDKHAEQFASFYNGGSWATTNPYYVKGLLNYYHEALEKIEK